MNIDIVNADNFIYDLVKYYLESHPKIHDGVISEALIEKWVLGFRKGILVSVTICII